jgi:hypothetical protein
MRFSARWSFILGEVRVARTPGDILIPILIDWGADAIALTVAPDAVREPV